MNPSLLSLCFIGKAQTTIHCCQAPMEIRRVCLGREQDIVVCLQAIETSAEALRHGPLERGSEQQAKGWAEQEGMNTKHTYIHILFGNIISGVK